MRSICAWVIDKYLRCKKMSPRSAERDLADTSDKTRCSIPKSIRFPRPMHERIYGDMQVFQCEGEKSSSPLLVYLHGSAYCHRFSKYHWRLLSILTRQTGCALSVPNYPLTPNYTWEDTSPRLLAYYENLCRTRDMSGTVLGGDSAGGGLALSLLVQARDSGLPLPKRLLLISPYVHLCDLSRELERRDSMLNCEGVLRLGEYYANGLSPENPILSPLLAPLDGLPTTDLWVGTWEILHGQGMAVHRKLLSSGVEVTLHEGMRLGHAFPLYPMPEGRRAIKEIAKFIKG